MICPQISIATSVMNASSVARARFSLDNDLHFSVSYSELLYGFKDMKYRAHSYDQLSEA